MCFFSKKSLTDTFMAKIQLVVLGEKEFNDREQALLTSDQGLELAAYLANQDSDSMNKTNDIVIN